MGKFDELTQYISKLRCDSFGDWHGGIENDGSSKSFAQLPFVAYSEAVHRYIDSLYDFCDKHPEYEHTRYGETLEESGLEWNLEVMKQADVSEAEPKLIIALLIGVLRGERFCEGVLLDALEDGCIVRWLERLKEID